MSRQVLVLSASAPPKVGGSGRLTHVLTAGWPSGAAWSTSSPPEPPHRPLLEALRRVGRIGGPAHHPFLHGTWGWKGNSWRPRGDFHEFILRNDRPNLYSMGAKFSWSDPFVDAHRARRPRPISSSGHTTSPRTACRACLHTHTAERSRRELSLEAPGSPSWCS